MTTIPYQFYSYEDYLIFLLMHCGFVDTELSAPEDYYISQFGKPEQIRRIKQDYAHSDAHTRRLVLQEFQARYCQKEDDQIKVLRVARGLFESDYRFSPYERQFFQELQHILR